jgi:hypothetical protein
MDIQKVLTPLPCQTPHCCQHTRWSRGGSGVRAFKILKHFPKKNPGTAPKSLEQGARAMWRELEINAWQWGATDLTDDGTHCHAFTVRMLYRLMELLRNNYSAATPEVDATEGSAQWDTEAFPTQSIESTTAVSNSALVRQEEGPSTAPRRFEDMGGTLYIHQSSLVGLHRILGHYVRCSSSLSFAFSALLDTILVPQADHNPQHP